MSQIANTIYQAIVSHTTWKKRLHDIIDAGVNGSMMLTLGVVDLENG